MRNGVKKTVLLRSSPISKADGTPREITMQISPDKMDKNAYKGGNIPLAVLLEGEFNSAYKDRIRPTEQVKEKAEKSVPTKMAVVADGDIIKNDIDGQSHMPLELGLDKWTQKFYDNKAFLQNTLNYLMDDTDFLVLRNKKVQLALLNKEKVTEELTAWRVKVLAYPLIALLLVTFSVIYIYKRKNIK